MALLTKAARNVSAVLLEPPWKMLLSNKAMLAILYQLFPECPYLLRTEFAPFGPTYVRSLCR